MVGSVMARDLLGKAEAAEGLRVRNYNEKHTSISQRKGGVEGREGRDQGKGNGASRKEE